MGVLVATETDGPRPVHLVDEWRLLQDYEATRGEGPQPSVEEAQELLGKPAESSRADVSSSVAPAAEEFSRKPKEKTLPFSRPLFRGRVAQAPSSQTGQ